MTTSESIPKCVFIELLGRYEWLNTKIIKGMRERYGTRFILLAGSEAVREYFRPFCTDQDQILTLDEVEKFRATLTSTLDAAFVARQNEEKYDINYLLDIIQQDRGVFGTYMPYAASSWAKKRVPNLDSLNGEINYYFKWANDLINREGVDLVILRPGGLLATTFITVATHKKIPVTMSRPSRYKSYLTWTYGAYSGRQIFEEAYNKQPPDGFAPVPLEEILPPEGSRQVFEQFQKQSSIIFLIRSLMLAVYNHTIHGFNALRRGEGHRIPSLAAAFNGLVYSWYSLRKLDSLSQKDLNSMCEKPFVAFLLPKEPEYTVQSLARNFSNVQAIVQQTAMCMPAGYNLVVKEHSRVGYRRLAFYEDLLKLPNVIFCNARIPGSMLMARASAVATIAGTAALEATLLGKKSLIFTPDVEFTFLPSVKIITSFDMLVTALRDAVKDETPEIVEKIRLSGARYRAAVAAVSYDAPNTKVFEGNSSLSDKELDRSIDLLIHSFQMQKTDLLAAPSN